MGTIALSVAYGLFFGNVVLLPLWLQQWMGYTATQAGLVLAPVGLLAIVLSPWVGKNVSRFDPRKLATFAFIVFGVVLWMRSNFNTQATFETILVPTHHPGRGDGVLLHPAADRHLQRPEARADCRPPRACRTSRASPRVQWARRSSPPCGKTAPRCTTRTWPSR